MAMTGRTNGTSAMNEPQHDHSPVVGTSAESLEKADRLAPLEEKTGGYAQRQPDAEGTPGVETGELILPKGLVEKDESWRSIFRLEPVVAVIFFVVVIFIAFIALLIRMTPSAK